MIEAPLQLNGQTVTWSQLNRVRLPVPVPASPFAVNGAIDRLRSARIEETPIEGFGTDAVRILAAIDPANPYGALQP